jgi:hypothetical protein
VVKPDYSMSSFQQRVLKVNFKILYDYRKGVVSVAASRSLKTREKRKRVDMVMRLRRTMKMS